MPTRTILIIQQVVKGLIVEAELEVDGGELELTGALEDRLERLFDFEEGTAINDSQRARQRE
jgi:hypothetical protein